MHTAEYLKQSNKQSEKPMQIFELKLRGGIPPLFFLVDEASAAAMPLDKMSTHERDGTRICVETKSKEPSSTFGYNYSMAKQYDRHYARLLLEEISRQTGFTVSKFAYTHRQAVEIFGKPFEEFLTNHQLPEK